MSNLLKLKKWAALGAAGALVVLGAQNAWAFSTGNTTTRAVLLQTEDSICANGDAGPDGFDNQHCVTTGLPFPCCTGKNLGTCNTDQPLPPQFSAAEAGCFVHGSCTAPGVPAGCTAAATFADTDGTGSGSADLFGVLSESAGVWTITVPSSVWEFAVKTTLQASGATFGSVTDVGVDFTLGAGSLTNPQPTTGPGTPYWSGTASFGAIGLALIGDASPYDRPFFGTASSPSETAFTTFGTPVWMVSQCLAATSPWPCCTGFVTGATCPASFPPTLPGTPLAMSCSLAWQFPLAVPFRAFGPGVPITTPGGGTPDFALCNPPGVQFGGDPGDNFAMQPGYDAGTETITTFLDTRTNAPALGQDVSNPVFTPLDWRVLETPDTDGDLVPDLFDNCTVIANTSQFDADNDGYGNQCDGDFNNTGVVDGTDFLGTFLADFGTGIDAGTGTDMNVSGVVDGTDFLSFFLPQFTAGAPGPSGLTCAGTVPCP